MNQGFICEIKTMLPSELEIARTLIDDLLNIKENSKISNQEYIMKYKNIQCPYCKSLNYKKNGHKNDTQRFYCKDCMKSFTITKNSLLYHTTINYYQLKTILKGIYDYKSVKEIALETKLSPTAIYTTEIKIFNSLNQNKKSIILKGVIEVDEKYVRISFKGTRHDNMPRKSRKNGFQDLTSGISKEQICIIVAIDSFDEIIIEVVGNGPASTDMISKALKGKIEEKSILITDSKNSYIKFARDNNLVLKQIENGKYKIDNYTLGNVNQLIGEIEDYLNKKKGLSTRHLQHHLNFIKYRKQIKYTIEYLEINEEMFKNTLLLNINLRNKDIYKTEMPFDIKSLYEDSDFK